MRTQMRAQMRALVAAAAALGIEAEYLDARGAVRTVPEASLRRLVELLGGPDEVDDGSLRPLIARREAPPTSAGDGEVRQSPQTEPLAETPPVTQKAEATPRTAKARSKRAGKSRVAEPAALLRILDGDRLVARMETPGDTLRVPDEVAPGIYRLAPDGAGKGEGAGTPSLIVAPPAAYQMEGVAAERVWVLAVQLYAVRSRRNWGHGDFADLVELVRLAASLGAAGVGLNPLHALFDDNPEQASPYSPNSRLFLNSLYIDLDAVPEFPGLRECGPDGEELAAEIERLRAAEFVDYAGVGAVKRKALRLAYARFRDTGSAERRSDFAAFRSERGLALTRYAAFETLRRRTGEVWWEWPAPWRCPDAAALARLREEAPDEMGYHEFVQWVADRQLAACQYEARRLALPIGLYIDLAVGVEPGGADAWSQQHAVVQQVEVGAPPDILNTAGQAWGLAAFNPRALEAEAFAPFADLLEAAMRYAGAIRLDHVLGLNRLFLIPFGFKPPDGAYVRYPLEAMLAIVALHSMRSRCLVIGEDLGTVPAELRGILADWGIWSYLVMLFERGHDGAFKPPEDYKRNALATFSTHDLPTFTGWRSGYDMQIKRAIGIDPGETDDEREQARVQLREAFGSEGLSAQWNLEFDNAVRFLARTPSRLLVVSIEDLLGMSDQPNIPGTMLEHPNWRRRLPVALEEFAQHPGLQHIAEVLREEGRAV